MDMMTYSAVVKYTLVITIVFYLTVLGFFLLCLSRTREEVWQDMQYIMLFFTIFTVPMFASHYNFG